MSTSLRNSLKQFLSIRTGVGTDHPILVALLERLGESDHKKLRYLGEGGNAFVYWMSDKKKVFKITQDPTDADACMVVKRKPDKNLVKVHDVFEIPNQAGRSVYVYGIVTEKLTPLARDADETARKLAFARGIPVPLTNINGAIDAFAKKQRVDPDWITAEDIQQLYTWVNALDSRHLSGWTDFFPDNLMARKRLSVVSDLGQTGAPDQSIPMLQV